MPDDPSMPRVANPAFVADASPDDDRFIAARSAFPCLTDKQYFNYGGQGPLPESAIAAMHQMQTRLQQIGPFSLAANAEIVQAATLARGAIAQELQVSPETIALAENVSVGCNIALWGIDWQDGDHLVITDCEQQGIVATVQELQYRFNLEVSVCPILETLNQGDPVAVIQQHLKPRTRLVVLSHVLWNTGQVLPLAEIVSACHSFASLKPVRVLADAAQSVGLLPLDLAASGVDFYAFTGHKWWCGPAGLGGLYVHPAVREDLRPTFVGWRSVTIDSQNHPTGWQPDSSRYEVSTNYAPLYAGFAATIAVHRTIGTAPERYAQICRNSGYLWQQLQALPAIACLNTSPPQSGLVCFQLQVENPQTAHAKLVQALEAQKFMLRYLLSPSCVRACVHYLTTEAEMDQLVAAIATYCQTNPC